MSTRFRPTNPAGGVSSAPKRGQCDDARVGEAGLDVGRPAIAGPGTVRLRYSPVPEYNAGRNAIRTAMMMLTWAGIALAVLVILLIAWIAYRATSENACCNSDGGCAASGKRTDASSPLHRYPNWGSQPCPKISPCALRDVGNALARTARLFGRQT